VGSRRFSAIRQGVLLQLSVTILLQYYEFGETLYVPREWRYRSTFILDKDNVVNPHQYRAGDKIENNEMGWPCGAYG